MRKFKSLAAILVIAAMVTSMIPAFAALSGISNETIAGGWTAEVGYSEGTISVVTGEGCLGKGSMKLMNPTLRTPQYGSYVSIYRGVAVKKGKTYQLEFDAKMEKASKNASVAFNWNRISLIPTTNSYSWMPFKLQYTPTQDETLMIRFLLEDKTDALWLDNIKFYDVEKETDNLIPNGDFENEDYFTVVDETPVVEDKPAEEESPYMFAVKKSIAVDGKADEWADIEELPITKYASWATFTGPMTCGVRFAYDEENLYFLVQAKDAVHYTAPSSSYWNGDGIQFGTAIGGTASGVTMKERGVVFYEDSGTYQNNTDFTAVASREGEITTYEVALPWVSDFGGQVPGAIRFNVIVNNNDDDGRGRYCLEITGGISDTKAPLLFKHLLMWTPVGGIEQCVMAPGNITRGEESNASIFLRNPGEEEKVIDLAIDGLNYAETITVPAGETVVREVPVYTEEVVDVLLGIHVACDGENSYTEQSVPVSVIYDAATYPELKERLSAYIPEIKELIMQCEEAGLVVDYEAANFAMMCKFLEYMDILAGYGDYGRMFEYEKAFMKLYHETVSSTAAYLNGEKSPRIVPKYITSKISLDGKDMVGMVDDNGTMVERPIYLVGYGNWETSVEEIPYFTQLGFNFGQLEVDTNKILVQSQILDWTITQSGSPKEMSFTRVSGNAVSGTQSLLIKSGEEGRMNHHMMLTQKIKVKPNTTYTYGMTAKGKGVTGAPYSAWFNMDGVSMAGRQTIRGTNDWENYEFEYTTSPGQESVDFVILVERMIDEMYIDDIFVKEKGKNENLVVNGDFEHVIQPSNEIERALMEEFGCEINPEYVNWMKKMLDFGKQHNYTFNPGLSCNYLPNFILATDPEMTAHTEYFLPWNMEHPKLLRFMSLWIQYLATIFNEYDNVLSINLMNEPALHANTTDFYLSSWHAYLKDVHGSIEKLNEVYGENYESFEDIEFPVGILSEARYHDYRVFSEEVVLRFVNFLAGEVRKYMPSKKLDIKVMDYFSHAYGSMLDHGSNVERLAEIVDINGCDAFSYYGNANTPLIMKMGWYDYLSSLSEGPTWDTESHISNDKAVPEYDNLVQYYTGADVWNGAIHGRNGDVIWMYDLRRGSLVGGWSKYQNANAINRPADVIEVSRAAMDLNRLTYEVSALKNATPRVGFLYSITSVGYNENAMRVCESVYSDILYSGQKVGFVIDEQPEEASQYELLIVPEMKNVSKETLDNIKKLIENGGKLLLVGEDCLKYDEYNRPHDAETLEYIYQHADTTSKVKEKIAQMKLSDVTLVDTSTGETPAKVEWCYTEHEGKMLVSIMSYQTQYKAPVEVYYKGEKVAVFTELRSGEQMENQITILPHQPVLLQFAL